eukprot:superscaffoldBa00004485_g18954
MPHPLCSLSVLYPLSNGMLYHTVSPPRPHSQSLLSQGVDYEPSSGKVDFPSLTSCTQINPCEGKAYAPEFYYDTYSALWQNRPRVYGFRLQWTQMEPNAVDRILAYRLGIRQMGQSRWWEQEIPMERNIQKGELLTHNLTELIKPESYLVRLTPITRYGEGDATERIITYSGEFQCGFEDEALYSCMSGLIGGFMQITCVQSGRTGSQLVTESSWVHSPLDQSGCDDARFLRFKRGEKLHAVVTLFLPPLAADLI